MEDLPHLPAPTPPPALGDPRAGGGTPILRRVLSWDPQTRQPVLRDLPTLIPSQVTQIAMAAALQPYVEPGDEALEALGIPLPPSRFRGMTNLEVMLIRQAENAAHGDADARESLVDRIAGKPTTRAENHTIKETYEGALRRIKDAVDVTEVAAAPAAPADPMRELY